MKRLIFPVGLMLLGVLLIMAGSMAPRRGLVVNKFDGKVVVNTHPQQPMELNPWQQPRLVLQMEWSAVNKNEVKIVLSFVSLAKKNKLCAGLVVVNGSVIRLGQAEHEYKVTKNGIWETAYVAINVDLLNQLAFVKMPLKIKVCGVEFFPHKYEAEDLRQAAELWRRW